MHLDPLPPAPFEIARPSTEAWMSTPWIAGVPIGGRRLGDVLAEQLQFEFVGDGAFSTRAIRPLTPGAAQALEGARGRKLSEVLRGVLATMDGTEGASNLYGISLATDEDGYALNRLMTGTQSGSLFVYELPRLRVDADTSSEGRDAFAEVVRTWHEERSGTSSGETGQFVDLGPRISGALLTEIDAEVAGRAPDAARRTDIADILDHELQHTVTPTVVNSGAINDPDDWWSRTGWLDEGIGEVLTLWPGRSESFLGQIGLPVDRALTTKPSPPYQQATAGVRRLLALHGINTNDPAARQSAFELLQGTNGDQLVRALSRSLAERNGLPYRSMLDIERALLATGPDPATFERIDSIIARG